ncbi:MAG: hypothetical protein H6712_12550 [Myxococcales bacterium]|nr:hypothetical protein [Myxococcales bacterium]MCB9714687.1 hypothetical protein [Myxococcales bacterium]
MPRPIPSFARSIPLALGLAASLVASLGSASPDPAQAPTSTPAAARAARPAPGDVVVPDDECIANELGECTKRLHKSRRECEPEETPARGDTCPAAMGEAECFIPVDEGVCRLFTCDGVDDGAVVRSCIGDLTETGCKATSKSCRPYVET